MTGDAERHQIARVMRAAVGERSDMMDEGCANVSPLLFAALAKWMRCQVSVTDFLPRTSVSLMLIIATSEVVIMPLHRFFVRLTVATLSIREVRTACHAAGSFRLSRHRFTSSMA